MLLLPAGEQSTYRSWRGAMVVGMCSSTCSMCTYVLSPWLSTRSCFFFFLIVHVRPQLMIDDQVFRFAHGENDFLKKRILVHSPASSSTPAGWRQTLGVEQGSWTWLSSEAGPRKHVWFFFVVVRCWSQKYGPPGSQL